jgi:hypothetical protein
MNVLVARRTQIQIGVMLFAAFLILTDFGAAQASEADFAEAVGELSAKLELDEEQSKKLGSSIQAYTKQLDALFAAQEGEDADPSLLINGVKDAQAGFESSLNSFMSSDQFNKYLELKEQAIKAMLSDLAAIQLMDAQSKTTISDDQIDELAPVLGNAFYGIIQIAWENAGKNLRLRQKIALAKKLKSIQSNLQKSFAEVLTPEQQQAWEAHKAEKAS